MSSYVPLCVPPCVLPCVPNRVRSWNATLTRAPPHQEKESDLQAKLDAVLAEEAREFASMDRNNDGVLDRDEVMAAAHTVSDFFLLCLKLCLNRAAPHLDALYS